MPMPPPKLPTVDALTLTVHQYAVVRGFNRQADLLRALHARGSNVPQATLSDVYAGRHVYPGARVALGAVLFPELDAAGRALALAILVANSATAAASRLQPWQKAIVAKVRANSATAAASRLQPWQKAIVAKVRAGRRVDPGAR